MALGKNTHITAVVCMSAAGCSLTTQVIFKGKKIDVNTFNHLPPKVAVTTSPKGWVDEKIKEDWIRNIAKELLPGRHLFICDGHNSNLSTTFLSFASKHNIDLLALPSHSSSFLQPLDNIPFKELKRAYKQVVIFS